MLCGNDWGDLESQGAGNLPAVKKSGSHIPGDYKSGSGGAHGWEVGLPIVAWCGSHSPLGHNCPLLTIEGKLEACSLLPDDTLFTFYSGLGGGYD